MRGTAHGEPITANGFREPRGLSAFSRVGRTEYLIVDRLARLGGGRAESFSLGEGLFGLGLIGGVSRPDGPGDASQLVGQGDGGAVVAAG